MHHSWKARIQEVLPLAVLTSLYLWMSRIRSFCFLRLCRVIFLSHSRNLLLGSEERLGESREGEPRWEGFLRQVGCCISGDVDLQGAEG